MQQVNSGESNKRKGMRLTKGVACGLLAVLIFWLGIGIGQGSISLGQGKFLNKGVSKNVPGDLDYSSVEQVYDILRKDYDGQLDTEKLLDGLKKGLAEASGDQYTEYLNAKEAEDFSQDLSGTFSGIGAELSKEEKTIVIVSPISGYPAEKAGLLPKDVIIEINGESAYDLNVSEAVNKIRGEEGTNVKLKVVRNGSQELDFEITRQKITIPSVESQTLDGNIGYIRISRFAEDTSGLVKDAATKFKQAGVKGVVVDLRSDPGGLLDAAVEASSQWLPRNKMVLQEKRDGVTVRSYPSKGYKTLEGVPTVVLVNEGSASASEIMAGALKDNGAAQLLGTKTFGKGSVQQLEELHDGSVLKVTIARWYTPNGKNIDKEGIEPDVKVGRSADDIKNGKDPQKDAALGILRK